MHNTVMYRDVEFVAYGNPCPTCGTPTYIPRELLGVNTAAFCSVWLSACGCNDTGRTVLHSRVLRPDGRPAWTGCNVVSKE